MSKRRELVPTSAASEGREWSARATAWAELWGGLAMPAFQAVADATGFGAGTRVLDVGCGSGEFCRLAAARGARMSGIDAAEGMIEIARRLVPGADLRVGAMERLPWDEDAFDVVTGFNAFQFAADMIGALRGAKRVARRGQVAICNWSRPQDRELSAVLGPLRELLPPPAPCPPPPPDPPAIGEPGVLEQLAREAGLDPQRADEVAIPYATPDQATLEWAASLGPAFSPRSSTRVRGRYGRRSWTPPSRSGSPTAPTCSRTSSGTSSHTRSSPPTRCCSLPHPNATRPTCSDAR